jgi:dihydroorotase
MNVLIKSATIVDKNSPFHLQKKDLLIENNVFVKIGNGLKCPKNFKQIELKDLYISNGWFDSSISLGEPGFEERETLDNGLDVAAKSGFTDIALNSNSQPLVDSKTSVSYLIHQSKHKATNLHPIASLTKKSKGVEMAELFDLKSSGAIAFGDYNLPVANENLLKIALLYAQNFDGLVLSFPHNKSIAGEGIANEGENSTRLGIKGIPNLAEELQISRDLFLLEYTGGKLHIPTISTAKSVELIRDAKQKNLHVTCSVSAHHLTLTDDELQGFNGNVKVIPPLRTKNDTEALVAGVLDGSIDCITSDHNPIDIEHKKVEFDRAKYGTIGLESLFGSLSNIFDIETIVELLTTKPRRVFGLKSNCINEGNEAAISLFSTTESRVFSEKEILSTSKNSLFLGKEIKGKVYGIYANHKLVLNEATLNL